VGLLVMVFPDDGKLECQSFDFRRNMASHHAKTVREKIARLRQLIANR